MTEVSESLTESALAPDLLALSDAYERHGAAVYGLARRLCDPRQAIEVARDSFVAMWRSPGDFGPEKGDLRSLLLADAHRRALTLLREEIGRRFVETGLLVDDPGQEVEGPRAGGPLHAQLGDLPFRERQVILLSYFGGYTHGQIATMLDQPDGTVKRTMLSGLRGLRAQLPSRTPSAGSRGTGRDGAGSMPPAIGE